MRKPMSFIIIIFFLMSIFFVLPSEKVELKSDISVPIPREHIPCKYHRLDDGCAEATRSTYGVVLGIIDAPVFPTNGKWTGFINITVTNTSPDKDDTFSLEATAKSEGWDVIILEPTIDVGTSPPTGPTKSTSVLVTCPYLEEKGDYRITIKGTSQGDPTKYHSIHIDIDVMLVPWVRVEGPINVEDTDIDPPNGIPDYREGAPGDYVTYDFQIRNVGNGEEAYFISLDSPNNWWHEIQGPSFTQTLDINQTAIKRVKVMISDNAEMGDSDVLKFNASSQTDSNTYHIGTVETMVSDAGYPIADAGQDQMVNQGDTVTFDGSGSSDNAGINNYTWTFNDEGIQTLYGITPSYRFENLGFLVVTLNITDSSGNWDTDVINVTVNDTVTPVASAGPDQTADKGSIVTFNGSASSDNIGIVNYTWSFIDKEETILFGMLSSYLFRDAGIYSVTLKVSDDAGNWDFDVLMVTVNDIPSVDNIPPIANASIDGKYVRANNIYAFEMKSEVTPIIIEFNANKSTDNVGIEYYLWILESEGRKSSAVGSIAEFTFSESGMYTMTLEVRDAMGHSDAISFYIEIYKDEDEDEDDNDLTSPIPDVSVDGNNIEEGGKFEVEENTTIEFDSSGSTGQGGIVNYTWIIKGQDGEIELVGEIVDYRFNKPGTYVVTLTVSDAEGNNSIMEFEIEVSESEPEIEPEEKKDDFPIWSIVVIVIILAGIIGVLVFVLRGSNKRKKEMMKDDQDLLGRVPPSG